MKLTKAETKKMKEVEQLVGLDRRLSEDERIFVLEHFHEGANQNNAAVGAFFTPFGLARDFSIEVPNCGRIVDLCAGIGALAYACEGKASEIVCVERNAEYVRIGRKVMPDAIWVHTDVFGKWCEGLKRFDCAISNPPFGAIRAEEFAGQYTGSKFEYKVIELASRIARYGAFIVPQSSAPFRYSQRRIYTEERTAECQKFQDQTAIDLGANCGIDTGVYVNEWRGVQPICEIVTADFEEIEARGQLDLFAQAA